MKGRRVVVTGMGILSPLGNSIQESWSAVIEGKSGIRLIDFLDTTDLTSKISGSVRNFNPVDFMPPKEVRRIDPFIQFGIAAASMALSDSGLEINEAIAGRVGVSVGAGVCGLLTMEKNTEALYKSGPKKISPFFIPSAVTNMVGGNISINFGLKGPNLSIVSACSTGTHNIGMAGRMIAYGDADVMFAGGVEMATCRLGMGGFCSLRALSTRNDEPEKASRPWDRDRDGFVMGDGAGVLVLEELEHAKKRGAKIYAELIGFGASADATHVTLPDQEGRGAAASMTNALNDAGINVDEVDYINAHGTSTQAGDVLEVKAVKKSFGDHAYKLAMSSTKSMTGHLLGAAGAVEAIFSIQAIRNNILPPTINLDNPSEGCDLNLVPHTAQEKTVKVSLSNSFGFGGTNGTIIFKEFLS